MDGHWVLGSMERARQRRHSLGIHRDAATLVPIIANHVTPRCIICSDEWSAHNQLSATTGHVHRTVNHSLYFVDPATAHTQGVEGMWSACKRIMREEKTMHSKLFDTYLPEFMWREYSHWQR